MSNSNDAPTTGQGMELPAASHNCEGDPLRMWRRHQRDPKRPSEKLFAEAYRRQGVEA